MPSVYDLEKFGASTDAAANQGLKQQADAWAARKEQDAKLRDLIQGKQLDQQNEAAKLNHQQTIAQQAFKDAQDYVDAERKKGRRVSASFGPQGATVQQSEMDPVGLFLRGQQMDDNKVMQFSDRVTKNDLPKLTGTMRSMEQETAGKDAQGNPVGGIVTNPNYTPKSTGPVLNVMPDFAKGAVMNIGEKVGLLEEGTAKEARAIQSLINVDTRNMSGTAVTAFESARNKLQQGLSAGADPALIASYVREAYARLKDIARNTEAGFDPRIRQKYKEQNGGELPSEALEFGGASGPETKTVNGALYQKVQGGWKRVQQ